MELSDKQETEFQTQSKGHAGNFCGNVLPQVSPSYFVSFYPLSTHELRCEGRCLEIETLVHIWEPGYVSHTSASPTSRSHSCGWEIGKHRCQHNASITLAFVLSPGDCTSLAHVQWHIPLQSPWWLNPAHSDAETGAQGHGLSLSAEEQEWWIQPFKVTQSLGCNVLSSLFLNWDHRPLWVRNSCQVMLALWCLF